VSGNPLGDDDALLEVLLARWQLGQNVADAVERGWTAFRAFQAASRNETR
jgi:hypothetical protein